MTQLLTREQTRKKYKALFSRLVTPLATMSNEACDLFINLCETNNEEKFRKAVGDFAASLLFIYRHFNELYKIKRGTIKTFLYETQTDEQLRELETILLKSDMFINLEDWTRQDLDLLDPSKDIEDVFNLKKVMHLFLNLDLSDSESLFDIESEANQGYEELEDDSDVDANLLHLAEEPIKKRKQIDKKKYTKPYLMTKKLFNEVMQMRGLEVYNSLFDDAIIE